jgi:Beta-lactamase superfamily domain
LSVKSETLNPLNNLKISRILHAGYIFESKGTKIIFDPIFENPFSQNCYAFPAVEFDHAQISKHHFSAIFISHYHDDHCSFESLNYLDKNTPIYMFCVHEEMFFLLRELGFKNVHALEFNQTVKINDFNITTHRALDADVDSIFQISVEQSATEKFHILNVVDSWIDDEIFDRLQKISWDLILWPFQSFREIEVISPLRAEKSDRKIPIELLNQLKILNPKLIVPSSCQFQFEDGSWLNDAFFTLSYEDFRRQIFKILPQTQILRMNPGVGVQFSAGKYQFAESINFIQPMGYQNADYELNDLQIPTTSEISKRFQALSEFQMQFVLDFCGTGLIQKYQTLDTVSYFNQKRIWKLIVYDHLGCSIDFYYEICGHKIHRTTETDNISWVTEAVATKIYGALKNGESLTSMYLRVNDIYFNSEIENEITKTDVIEDPLIRCLYNGEFASYQKAQLKKLRKNKI